MNLEIQDGPTILISNTTMVYDALQKLDGDKSSFAILSDDPHSFLQVAGDRQSGYTLEYKDRKTGRHYVCPDDVSFKVVVEAFQDYANRGEKWKMAHTWVPLKSYKPEKHSKRSSPKSFDRSLLWWIPPLVVFALMWLDLFAYKKGLYRLNISQGIFCFGMALLLSSFLIETQVEGRFTGSGYRIITRDKSPIRFWAWQITTALLVIFLVVLGILLIIGVIPAKK